MSDFNVERFCVVLADPPWMFTDRLPGPGRGAVKHYPCLSVPELCAFPLPPLADDCTLFLWRVASRITSIDRAKLPFVGNRMGYGCIAVGGGDDFYMLDEEDGYSLPFKVWGYFDLVGCELVDEPDETYRQYEHVMSVDAGGRVHLHKETQREARAREDTPTPTMLESYMQTGQYFPDDSNGKGGA